MVNRTIRIALDLPGQLIDEIDQYVGRNNLDAFLAEALTEKLERERLGRALKATAGYLPADAYPEWETPEKVSAWVRQVRSVDREFEDRKLGRLKDCDEDPS